MTIYWLLFLVPLCLAIRESVRRKHGSLDYQPRLFRLQNSWWLVVGSLTVIIGWRYQVGGDWFNYLYSLENTTYFSSEIDWWRDDPGYRLLEWISTKAGWGIYGVNLIGAFLFSLGLVVFCLHLPRPWLALTVSVPYMITVLGMGYTRQGIALGLLMIGLVTLSYGQIRYFIFWSVIAATFHKSAVLLIPIALFAAGKRGAAKTMIIAVVTYIAYTIFLQDAVERLVYGYIHSEYQSEGALVRLLMNAVPAIIFLWRRRKFNLTLQQEKLWRWLSLLSIFLCIIYVASPSTTALDRIGLYLLPLQLMVCAYVPEVLGRTDGRGNAIWLTLILLYYGVVNFVWLNYAHNAESWLPYRWFPLEWLSN